MSAIGDPRDRGFTLLEMLVVLAILGLIGGLIYPGLARGIRAQQFRGAVSAAASALRAGRARAFARGGPARVSVTVGGAAIAVDGAAPDPLPGGVRAAAVPRAGIVFYRDGSSSGGSLSIVGEGRVVRFVVAPATGLARSAG